MIAHCPRRIAPSKNVGEQDVLQRPMLEHERDLQEWLAGIRLAGPERADQFASEPRGAAFRAASMPWKPRPDSKFFLRVP